MFPHLPALLEREDGRKFIAALAQRVADLVRGRPARQVPAAVAAQLIAELACRTPIDGTADEADAAWQLVEAIAGGCSREPMDNHVNELRSKHELTTVAGRSAFGCNLLARYWAPRNALQVRLPEHASLDLVKAFALGYADSIDPAKQLPFACRSPDHQAAVFEIYVQWSAAAGLSPNQQLARSKTLLLLTIDLLNSLYQEKPPADSGRSNRQFELISRIAARLIAAIAQWDDPSKLVKQLTMQQCKKLEACVNRTRQHPAASRVPITQEQSRRFSALAPELYKRLDA